MSKCRACNAEIMWQETKNGKKMPINADDRHTPHWATCPHADRFKKAKKQNDKIIEQMRAEKKKEYGLI